MEEKLDILEIGPWRENNVLDRDKGIPGLLEKTASYTSVTQFEKVHPDFSVFQSQIRDAILLKLTGNFTEVKLDKQKQYDRAYCGNVINSPNFTGGIGKFFKKLHGSVQNGGIAIIWATDTPHMIGLNSYPPSKIREKLLFAANKAGFTGSHFITPGLASEWEMACRDYLPKKETVRTQTDPKSYILLLSKA